MKNKQIIGIVIAGVVFVCVCLASTATNYITESMNKAMNKLITEGGFSYTLPATPYVGLVKVEGTIANTQATWLNPDTYDHQGTLQYIDAMIRSTNNKGILLCVDSPGGYVYETDELYLKLKEYKEVTKRPIWAYMENTACSGGYYITMASDKIYGNRNGMTGSIGVILSMNNVKGLYDKLGIEEIDITSGKNKAMGSAGLEMSEEQREIYQSIVDESYDQFLDIIAEGRKMDKEKVKGLADGRVYTMSQAKNAGLIDEVKTWKETEAAFLKEIGGSVKMYEPNRTQPSWFSSLVADFSENIPKSELQIQKEMLEEQRNGVPMYYAY